MNLIASVFVVSLLLLPSVVATAGQTQESEAAGKDSQRVVVEERIETDLLIVGGTESACAAAIPK